MSSRPEEIRIEVIDDDMARILRAKSGAERLKIANDMRHPADDRQYLAAEHPDWSEEEIRRETSRRISHGSV